MKRSGGNWLYNRKSFPCLNTNTWSLQQKINISESKNFPPMELVNRPTRACKTLQSAQNPSAWSLWSEIHISEYGETGELSERHSFRLLYIIVIQYAYLGFCCWFGFFSSCLTVTLLFWIDYAEWQQSTCFWQNSVRMSVSNNAASSVGNDEETTIRNPATEIKDTISLKWRRRAYNH